MTDHNENKPHIKDSDNHDGIVFEVVEKEVNEGQSVVSAGVYFIPNLITTLSLLSGFLSVLLSSQGHFYKAAIAIFISAVLDGLDGRAARLLNAQSAFGEQFDSLTDLLAFGVAPAILMYNFVLQPFGRIGTACAFIFTACTAFRLARFNVQVDVVDKNYFVGVPSPTAAMLIGSFIMVAIDHKDAIEMILQDNIGYFAVISAVWTVVCALLMVSNIKYYSFKEFDKKKVPFAVLVLSLLIIVMALYNIPVGILLLGFVYLLSGLYTNIQAKKQNN